MTEYEPIIRSAIFIITLATIMLWEHHAPARALILNLKKRLAVNLGLGFCNMILLRLLVPILALETAIHAQQNTIGLLNQTKLPHALSILITILALDLLIYAQHALLHKIPALWRIHAAHHTDPDIDASSALRFHPIEILLSMGIKITAVYALGAAAYGVMIFEILLSSMAIFNHANASIKKPYEKYIRAILVTPDMHRTHHSIRQGERDTNFGFILSLWDRIFRTYTDKPQKTLTLGLPPCKPADTTRLLWILQLPFLTRLLFAKR